MTSRGDGGRVAGTGYVKWRKVRAVRIQASMGDGGCPELPHNVDSVVGTYIARGQGGVLVLYLFCAFM